MSYHFGAELIFNSVTINWQKNKKHFLSKIVQLYPTSVPVQLYSLRSITLLNSKVQRPSDRNGIIVVCPVMCIQCLAFFKSF